MAPFHTEDYGCGHSPSHDRLPILPDELVAVAAVPDAEQDPAEVSRVVEKLPTRDQA